MRSHSTRSFDLSIFANATIWEDGEVLSNKSNEIDQTYKCKVVVAVGALADYFKYLTVTYGQTINSGKS